MSYKITATRTIGVLFLFFCFSCNNVQENRKNSYLSKTGKTTVVTKETSKFTGKWSWENEDGTNSFTIELVNKNDSIYGQYCGSYYSGNRLDCDLDTVYNMKGKIRTDSVFLIL